MAALAWLAATLGAAGLGWGYADLASLDGLAQSPNYHLAAATLLAVGLFSSAYGISLPEARQDLVPIALVTTVGVVAKASLIAGGMYLLFHQSRYAVLGIVVAQIDPLSVAAMRRRSGMSERAKTLLSAWSSFDDPVTALLIIYAAGWVTATSGPADRQAVDSQLNGYGGGLVLNLLLALVAFVLWWTGRVGYEWISGRLPVRRQRVLDLVWQFVMGLILLSLVGAAVAWFLMLGLAATGLFFLRPHIGRIVQGVTWVAFLAAAFALGLLFPAGFDIWRGLALGLFAFAAQALAGAALPTRLAPRDRVYLALGQQNGITAIILAIVLEPSLPGTVAIVAPAILTVNLLHLLTNAWWDLPHSFGRRMPGTAPQPVPPQPQAEPFAVSRSRDR